MEKKFNKIDYINNWKKNNISRIVVELSPEIKQKYKLKCDKNNTKMQTEINKFILNYIDSK